MKKYLFIIFCIAFFFGFSGNIQAQTTVCAGATITLTGATTGGTWSSGNTAIATVGSSTGVVSGVSAGAVAITYTTGLAATVNSVTVNPTPSLSGLLSLGSTCDSGMFNYIPASSTTGTTFSWSLPFVPGIEALALSGSGSIGEILINTTYIPVPVSFTYTLSAGGCINTQSVSVTVNPTPRLSTSLTVSTICDSTVFNYAPASATPGTAFSWSRPYIPGIYSSSTTGTGILDEALVNTTNVPVAVPYFYLLSAYGCFNIQPVTVIVNPAPMLSSALTAPSICNGSEFIYTPTSNVPGTAYAWNRPVITGINPATNFGVDGVNEFLHNTTTGPVVVSYFFRLTIGTCTNIHYETVTVTVDTCSSVETKEIPNPSEPVKIYPNPSSGSFTVEMPGHAGNGTVTISDMLGKEIEVRHIKDGSGINELFNLSYLSPGIYLIKADTDGQSYREKIEIR